MKCFLVSAVATVLSLCALSAHADSVAITVSPSVAPNAYGSSSWSGYVANAMNGLQNGLTVVGDRNTSPTGYTGGITSVTPGQIEVTSFNSWEGNPSPTGAFAGEYGNRLHFGVTIQSDTAFDLADVNFSITSNDPGNDLGYSGDLSGTDFSTGTRIGIYYGADGIPGTADDVVYNAANPGNDKSLINELFYVGVGNAEWPGGNDPAPSNPLLGKQGAIDATNAFILNNITTITGTYTLNGVSGTANVSVAPLPASVWSGLTMLGAVVAFGQWKRSRLAKA